MPAFHPFRGSHHDHSFALFFCYNNAHIKNERRRKTIYRCKFQQHIKSVNQTISLEEENMRKIASLIGVFALASLLLAACGGGAVPTASGEPVTVKETV